jgi:MSHA biogenesis protein MshN
LNTPTAIVAVAPAGASAITGSAVSAARNAADGERLPAKVVTPRAERNAKAVPSKDLKPADAEDSSSTGEVSIDKQVRPMAPQERADMEFHRGMSLLQQGRSGEAEMAWRSALTADSANEPARQALVGLKLERGQRDEAEQLLREAIQANPRPVRFAMLLARLELERGAQQQALETLEAGLPYGQSDAEYLATAAAVTARASRFGEAAKLYEAALRIHPGNAVWQMGLGMALRDDGRRPDALIAFRRARDLKLPKAELQAYVEGQVRQLQ